MIIIVIALLRLLEILVFFTISEDIKHSWLKKETLSQS